MAECGTTWAYRLHRRRGEECPECREANRLYQETRRRRLGVQPWTPVECGTNAGYTKHYETGTPVCEPCREARAAYNTEWWQAQKRRKLRGSSTDVVQDWLETHGPIEWAPLQTMIQARHPDIPGDTLNRALWRLRDRGLAVKEDGVWRTNTG